MRAAAASSLCVRHIVDLREGEVRGRNGLFGAERSHSRARTCGAGLCKTVWPSLCWRCSAPSAWRPPGQAALKTSSSHPDTRRITSGSSAPSPRLPARHETLRVELQDEAFAHLRAARLRSTSRTPTSTTVDRRAGRRPRRRSSRSTSTLRQSALLAPSCRSASPPGAAVLVDALIAAGGLRELQIDHLARRRGRRRQARLQPLRESSTLEILNADDNAIGPGGAAALAAGVRASRSLISSARRTTSGARARLLRACDALDPSGQPVCPAALARPLDRPRGR